MSHACPHPASNTSSPKQWFLPENYFLLCLLGLYPMLPRDGRWLEQDGEEEETLTPVSSAALQWMAFLLHAGHSAGRVCPAESGTAPRKSSPWWWIKVPIRLLKLDLSEGMRLQWDLFASVQQHIAQAVVQRQEYCGHQPKPAAWAPMS